MKVIIIFVYSVSVLVTSEVAAARGCLVSINEDLGDLQPLLLKPNGTDYDPFLLPESSDKLRFANADIVDLACPGSALIINSNSTNTIRQSAKCISGTKFEINGSVVQFSQISCRSVPEHVARYNGKSCHKRYKEIEIGFEVETRFLVQIIVCFDDVEQNAVYSWYNLSSRIGYQSVYPRPSYFRQGTFYNVGSNGVNLFYTRNKQRNTTNTLLGLPYNSTKYIHTSDNYYLARGHLTAKTDFIFSAQQRLTFYFVNAAPQWQTFNGGNWKVLEDNVRDYASSTGSNLIVYTGTYGVTTLPHEKLRKDRELHLYVDENGNKAIAVPQLFWKFVYNQVKKSGVVFVGINNPYEANKSKNVICKDVSDSIDWLTWQKDDQLSGYGYACEVDAFRKVVSYLPYYETKGLLK